MGKLEKYISITLIVAIVAAIGCLSYIIATPKQGEKYTEFYILNNEGKIENYPQHLLWSESAEIIIGVVNNEHEQVTYRIEVIIDGIDYHEINIDTLDHEEKWEQLVNITPPKEGNKQRIEFWLYKNSEDKPYFEDPLNLCVDVTSFYVLDAKGKTIESTQWVKRGNPIGLNIGIVNKENEPSTYRIEIKINDILQETINTKTINHLELWQEKISFYLQTYGELELWLYKNSEVEPYKEEPLSFRIILY